jgi:hypothetical protein
VSAFQRVRYAARDFCCTRNLNHSAAPQAGVDALACSGEGDLDGSGGESDLAGPP